MEPNHWLANISASLLAGPACRSVKVRVPTNFLPVNASAAQREAPTDLQLHASRTRVWALSAFAGRGNVPF